MRINNRSGALSLVFGVVALVGTSGASAGTPFGAVITYAPAGTSSIPTLSEWGLIAMSVLLIVMAYRSLRGRLGGKPVAAVLVAGALGIVAAHSTGWVRPAAASPSPSVSLGSATGGSANVLAAPFVDIVVTNTSGVPLKLVSVGPLNNYTLEEPEGTPKCVASLLLPSGASCFVHLSPPPV